MKFFPQNNYSMPRSPQFMNTSPYFGWLWEEISNHSFSCLKSTEENKINIASGNYKNFEVKKINNSVFWLEEHKRAIYEHFFEKGFRLDLWYFGARFTHLFKKNFKPPKFADHWHFMQNIYCWIYKNCFNFLFNKSR